jgi:hypothetical protein
VGRQEVLQFSPPLADKLAIDTSRVGSQDVALQILRVVRHDLYSQYPRAWLERIARGQAITELQSEIVRMREELETTREELSEFQCPYCQAPLGERISAPADSSHDHWDLREIYDCGYQSFGGYIESAYPSDPNFPKLEEYDLEFDSDAKVLCSSEDKHGSKAIALYGFRAYPGGSRDENSRRIRETLSKVPKLTKKCSGRAGKLGSFFF